MPTTPSIRHELPIRCFEAPLDPLRRVLPGRGDNGPAPGVVMPLIVVDAAIGDRPGACG